MRHGVGIIVVVLGALAGGRTLAASDDELSGEAATTPEPVEAISFQEVLPNEAGELSVRASMQASPRAADTPFGFDGRVTLEAFVGLGGPVGVEVEVPVGLRLSGGALSGALGDLELSVKVAILRTAAWALVVSAQGSLPTGDAQHGFGEGRPELGGALGAVTTTGRWTLQGWLGASAAAGEEVAGVANASLALRLAARLYGFLEATSRLGGAGAQLALSPGLKWTFGGGDFAAAALSIDPSGGENPALLLQVQHAF